MIPQIDRASLALSWQNNKARVLLKKRGQKISAVVYEIIGTRAVYVGAFEHKASAARYVSALKRPGRQFTIYFPQS